MAIVFLIAFLIWLAWYTTPQVEMTDQERAEQDRKAFIKELQRLHGERSGKRNWFNR